MGAKLPRLAAFQAISVLVLVYSFCSPATGATLNPRATPRPDFWDVDGTVHALLATNGIVYVGGEFSYVSGQGSRLLAVDRYTGEVDPSFPSFYGSAIYALLDDGAGGWFVAGDFDRVGVVPATNFVHILADNTVDLAFGPN